MGLSCAQGRQMACPIQIASEIANILYCQNTVTSFSRYPSLLKIDVSICTEEAGRIICRGGGGGGSGLLTTLPCVYGRAGRQELPNLSCRSVSSCNEKWEQRENEGILRNHYLYTEGTIARKHLNLLLENACVILPVLWNGERDFTQAMKR